MVYWTAMPKGCSQCAAVTRSVLSGQPTGKKTASNPEQASLAAHLLAFLCVGDSRVDV